MVKTMDIINEVIKALATCVPKAECYLGRIGEEYAVPAFLFLLVYDGSQRSSKFTRDVAVDLQIVYFGKVDEYGNHDFEDRAETSEKMKAFLERCNLPVGDRVLTFNYEMKGADEQLSVFLSFRFKDGVWGEGSEEETEEALVTEVILTEGVNKNGAT